MLTAVRFWTFIQIICAFMLSGCSLSATLDNLLSAAKKNPIAVDGGIPVVNTTNQGSFNVTGVCDDSTNSFNITSPSATTVSCVNGVWSVIVDFSGQPDGPVKIVTDIKDANGNSVEFELMKDTTPPVLTSLVLDSGKSFTKNTVLPVSVTHSDGYSIYLTQVPGCASGGVWSLLALTGFGSIGAGEGAQTLYAKVRDTAGNESNCVSDDITLDLTAPVVTGLSDDVVAAKSKSWSWSCTDISPCKYRFVIDQSAVANPTGGFSSTAVANQNSGDGAFYIHVQAEDEAGNIGTTIHVSAILDNTGPTLVIGAPSPTTGNSAQNFQWVVTYADAHSISLSDSDVSLSGSATTGCVASVSGAGTTSRTVSVTGCSANGTLGFSLAANTAVDSLGNSSLAEGPSSVVTVNNIAPTFTMSSASLSAGVAATVFEWTVTYTGADAITLAAGDISYTAVVGTGSQNCLASVSTVSASVRKIEVTGCSGDGTFRLAVAAGTASNTAGNSAAGFTSAEVISVYNTPVIASLSGDVSLSYKTTDSPYLTWQRQADRGSAPAKYDFALGTTSGGTQVVPWTDVGLVNSYVRTDLSLSYGTQYYASVRLTDVAGRVSSVKTFSFRPTWGGSPSVSFPNGTIYSTVKDSTGRRLVAGSFTQIVQSYQAEKYLTGMTSDGVYQAVNHGFNHHVRKALELPGGKILVIGDFTLYGTQSVRNVARLNADGSLDSGFIAAEGFTSTPTDMILQADGKILIGGSYDSLYPSAFRIIRLNSDGSRDVSFNVGTEFNSFAQIYGMALQADSKIIVVGSFTTYNGESVSNIVRLNSDGSRDTSFSTGTGFNAYATRAVVQSNGKIVVSGAFKTFNGVARGGLARLNSDGSLDMSFGAGAGYSSNWGAGVNVTVQNLLIDSGDKLYALAAGSNRYDGASIPLIVRINADGTLDTSFSFSASVQQASALTLQGGKLLVGATYSAGEQTSSVIRVNSDGSVDSSFHYDQGSLDRSVTSILSRSSDNNLWVMGDFRTRQQLKDQRGIARFNLDGTLDSTFLSRFDSSGFGQVDEILLQADGKILARGSFNLYFGSARFGMVRINSDGTLDTSFSPSVGAGVQAMMIRSDQKIYVGGSFNTGSEYGRFALLNTDGSTNNSFSGTGSDLLDGDVTGIAILPNGNVLVGGKFNQVGSTVTGPLISLTPTGGLDGGFSWTTLASETAVEITRIVSSGAGGVIAIAASYATDYFDWQGSLQPTRSIFIEKINNGGSSAENPIWLTGDQAEASISAMYIQSDGKFYIASESFNAPYQQKLARYLANGSFDMNFRVLGYDGATCIYPESDTAVLVSSGGISWKSRDYNSAFMSVISP